MNKTSKFEGVLSAARSRSEEDAAPGQNNATAQAAPQERVFDKPLAPRIGRPRAKRSDSKYRQVTAYIEKDTHQAVKIALLQQGNGQEFSELMEQLLTHWLKTQK